MTRFGERPVSYKHQADATLSQTNPVSGTKYEVLATTKNARIRSIHIECTWTVQPTPLEIHITVDGQPLTASFTNPVSAQDYYVIFYPEIAQPQLEAASTNPRYTPFLLEGRSVKIEAEITGGTVSNLSVRVKYATKS